MQHIAGKILRTLGYAFRDESLLTRALTHRSVGARHNERLEFLGDALLGMVVAEHLFSQFPDADEGQLTRTRATLVNRESLAEVGRGLELGDLIRLGEGDFEPLAVCPPVMGNALWTVFEHIWRPARRGEHVIRCAIEGVPTRRLDTGYYDRAVVV